MWGSHGSENVDAGLLCSKSVWTYKADTAVYEEHTASIFRAKDGGSKMLVSTCMSIRRYYTENQVRQVIK
jgi:hypothetical protein